jgi:putative PEP-CTERM system integral membrane protein
MYPFFYQDIEKEDYEIVHEAEKIYSQFFDEPINNYSYYYDHWVPYANVHIDKQEINITEYVDIAEIEICESYITKSDFTEEIIYHFTLPYNSVITGLWISDDKNLDKKYPGFVAPSGAAQKVYLNEVHKQVDPALLSQTGPNEYLLRAFPIMSKERLSQDTAFDAKYINSYQFRLWFRYKTFISENKNWKMPKLQYNWNVKWSDKTKTIVNGKTYNRQNRWLPEFVPATKPTRIKEHATAISDTIQISSKPIEPHEWVHFNQNIAFLIDGSYSMNKKRQELTNKFNEISEMFPNFKELDCFLVGEEINKLKAGDLLNELDGNPQLFFGNTNYMDILKKFTTQYKGYSNVYESVILISDIIEYRYSVDGIAWDYDKESLNTFKPTKLACPFIIIQLSEENYNVNPDDFFNQLVYKSNGGFAKNKYELFNLLYTINTHIDDLVAYQDGIAYFKSKIPTSTDSLFKDFATKEFINFYELDDSTKLADIDVLNEMAKNENIVTKYSSMIALVNQEQVDSLKSAETHPDRYNHFRESNSSGDGIMGLLNMFGPSVPKHTENTVVFMFLLLVSIMIFAYRLR